MYSSQILGRNGDLVLHGGGNTSVKITELLGHADVRRWLESCAIEPAGFAGLPQYVDTVGGLRALDDTQMVRLQRAAMTNPDAPNPSVEAILHAIIPYTFVITPMPMLSWRYPTHRTGHNDPGAFWTPSAFVPYIIPSFKLAKAVRNMTETSIGHNWMRSFSCITAYSRSTMIPKSPTTT